MFSKTAIIVLAFACSLFAFDVAADENGVRASTVSGGIDLSRQEPLIISSFRELDRYLGNADLAKSPLGLLSEAGLERFVESLVFTELGLGSFSSEVLTKELTPSEAYRFLSLFGVEFMVPSLPFESIRTESDRQIMESGEELGRQSRCPLIEDTFCSPPATCKPAGGSWCITCNCGMQTP